MAWSEKSEMLLKLVELRESLLAQIPFQGSRVVSKDIAVEKARKI